MKLNCAILVASFGVIGLISFVKGQSVVCPAVRTTSGWLDLFPLPCKKTAECRSVMGAKYLCCNGSCTKGVKPAATLRDKETKSSLEASSITPSSTSTTTTTAPSTTTTTTTTPLSTTTTTTPPSTTRSTTTTTPPSTTTTTTTTTTTPSTTTSSTTTTPRPKTTVPTEPPRPYLQILPILESNRDTNKKATKNSKSQKLICPKPSQIPIVLFPLPCENTAQCISSSGAGQVCCQRQCVKGVPAPKLVSKPRTHQPLLGVIPRECPSAPLGELLFEVQTCKTDADCWPRVCCADGSKSYCRTAKARLDLVPIANQIDQPVRMLEQYLQCTAPPKFDAFPRQCTSSVDCFPNLCCAEGGKKHCRPPQRSLLALLAGVTQRFGNLRPAQGGKKYS